MLIMALSVMWGALAAGRVPTGLLPDYLSRVEPRRTSIPTPASEVDTEDGWPATAAISAPTLMARALKARGLSQDVFIPPDDATWPTFNATAGDSPHPSPPQQDALMILLPLLIVLSTFLFLLLVFLICVLLVRRRRGIALRDSDGPVDMSREELIDGEGGFEGVESRWLETVPEHVQRDYRRAKGTCHYQLKSASGDHSSRVPAAVPAQFLPDRYHSLAVPIYSGEGRVGLVL